jgi:ubiquinone/menaquinone biosynthesis C-methylase UbiE
MTDRERENGGEGVAREHPEKKRVTDVPKPNDRDLGDSSVLAGFEHRAAKSIPYTPYLMESKEEYLRLDLKTDIRVVEEQARWAGIEPGMDVLDVGCGTGKTTIALYDLVGPGGSATGVDFSNKRIAHAEKGCGSRPIKFLCRDFTQSLDDIGQFDFVWIRFILEYFREGAIEVVKNVARLLRPNGILCLVDLDYNSMNYYEMSPRLEKTVKGFIGAAEERANFDPYAGRKLYSFLYRLKFVDVRVTVGSHNLIYGDLRAVDAYNLTQKIKVSSSKIGFDFSHYPRGCEGFVEELMTFFKDPSRFSYTPLICARGRRQ